MNIAVAIGLALVPWFGAAVLLAVLIVRIVRLREVLRDGEVDAVVQAEMTGIDDEYEALVKGGAR